MTWQGGAGEDPAAALVRGAVGLRRGGDPQGAARVLEGAVRRAESSLHLVTAYLELGKALDLLGRRRPAQSCYRRVMALTDDWTFRDQARRLFRKPYRN